jgi:uroporphyrinogen decarboxylase
LGYGRQSHAEQQGVPVRTALESGREPPAKERSMMTHRERILAAVGHREPDRVPRDLGGCLATTLTAEAHARLRAHLGLPDSPPPAWFALRSSTVIPDEAILRRFDVDARGLLLGAPDAHPDQRRSEDTILDEWGVTWTRPKGGHFLATDGPFHRIDEPRLADLERLRWPDPDDPGRYRGLRERARALHEGSDYAVVLTMPLGPVHLCQFMRGFAEWLEDLLIAPDFAQGLLERAVDIWAAIAERALREAGPYVDIVMYGDDVGTQGNCMVSPQLYRQLIKPGHKRMADAIKRHGKPILYHTCGSVYKLLPYLIDVGIDILNPVQVTAAEMDPARLKREFGRDLAFWGGIDTQQVLPRGTPQDVREDVRRRIADLAEGGGYVLCAVHNIQAEVPPQNVVAMYDAGLELGARH